MARKHSSRHHLQPRDLITHQANQTSKPKSFCSFFFRKLLEKRFLGRGGGGQTKHHNQKSFVFFLGKLLEKCFWKFLALPGQNMAWYGHGRPRHCRVTHWHALAFRCLGIVLAWLLQPTPLPSMSFPWKPLAWPLQPMPLPWLPMACLGIA
jgi:hypothetical protein